MEKLEVNEPENCRREKDFIKRLLNVGTVLSSEKNVKNLLKIIVGELKAQLHADRATLFILDREKKELQFFIAGDDELAKETLPLDQHSIAGFVAFTGESLSFDDVYELPAGAPYHFNRDIDTRTHYRTQSMLAVPMKNRAGDTIGVIQLLNRMSNGEIVSFDDDDREILLALSSQAAVSLENALLHQEVEDFIVATVKVLATAIESRDPITAGHSLRVANYALELARATGRFTDIQLRELYYAAWLHDVGKIGVRENVLQKAMKLDPLQLQLIEKRFDVISAREEITRLLKIVHCFSEDPEHDHCSLLKEDLEKESGQRIEELEKTLDLIREKNMASILPDEESDLFRKIGETTYTFSGREIQLLTLEEIESLSIRKGTLTEGERKEIESHVNYTYQILKDIPFPRDLKNVPLYASMHHEKLNGKGYPFGYRGDEIPVQGRILTIADIYDALVAKDRPYKKAVPREVALKILQNMVNAGELDGELFALFVDKKIYETEVQDPQYEFIQMIQKEKIPQLT